MARWVTLMAVMVAVVTASEMPAETRQENAAPAQATGRTFAEWGQDLMRWMGFDYDDYDDYDYDYNNYDYSLYYPSAQVGYGLPSVGYVAPSGSGDHHSSYSSYSPYQVAPHPQHIAYNARKDDYEDSTWSFTDVVMGAMAMIAPAVLLGTALPTNLLTVALRRSFDGGSEIDMMLERSDLPLLNTIVEGRDFSALLAPQCQRKLFCEITKIGENENASLMQRAFYYVAMLTPDPLARRVGLARTFRAARAGQCEALVCHGHGQLPSLTPPAVLPPSNHLPEDSPSSSSSSSSPDLKAEE